MDDAIKMQIMHPPHAPEAEKLLPSNNPLGGSRGKATRGVRDVLGMLVPCVALVGGNWVLHGGSPARRRAGVQQRGHGGGDDVVEVLQLLEGEVGLPGEPVGLPVGSLTA